MGGRQSQATHRFERAKHPTGADSLIRGVEIGASCVDRRQKIGSAYFQLMARELEDRYIGAAHPAFEVAQRVFESRRGKVSLEIDRVEPALVSIAA